MEDGIRPQPFLRRQAAGQAPQSRVGDVEGSPPEGVRSTCWYLVAAGVDIGSSDV
jgi:hypothetical protein